MLIIYIAILFTISFAQFAPHFDGESAFDFLNKQCSFGPRNPGSEGHANFKDYLINYLKPYSDEIIIDEHNIPHPYADDTLKLFNIVAKFNPNLKNRLLLMAHWDTREIADKDPDKNNYNTPILGANDGASGISILMLFAEMFHLNPLENIGIDLLFVDGEDIGRHGDLDNFSLGTKLYAKSLKKDYPQLAICLDMVADADPQFKIEYYSYLQAQNDVIDIWDLAISLGYREFSYEMTSPIYDDHRAFYLATGIPSIDIIDFEYPYWHTLEDTPDKCSANTLSIVGTVVSEYIYRMDQK